ncbi:MAG: 2Fe-2S iron-sulfur cluster binding domain-containing protein [Salinibacterium sp.]|nr:MAG: 2Fe-2S iron-sulfur cluster binding domain-containing protein [Salinibacterium sp.]
MTLSDPHLWWYISRASALLAWALLTLSVVWGILLSTRLLRRVDNPSWLQDIHRFVSGLGIIMVLLHMVTLMLDGWLHLSFAQVLLPWGSSYRPLPVALGVIAFYLLIAVQGSSMIMHRLPRKFWKAVHYASYATVVLVSFHAGLAGTDVGSPGYRILAYTLIGLTAAATVVRIAVSNRARAATKAEVWVPPRDRSPRVSPPEIDARRMIVTSTGFVAENVLHLRLAPLDRRDLPVWYPGAHITLNLPSGLERQYSLCGDPGDRGHYDIAVLLTENSAGGSLLIHESVVQGSKLTVSSPLNHFELEPARDYLFIAGGIGITPIKAMIESLPAARSWRLIYVGRSRRTMAFAKELEKRYPARVLIHASDEHHARLAFDQLKVSDTTEVYCCGPESLLASVSEAVPVGRLHVERFVPVTREAGIPNHEFRVRFSRNKRELTVGAEENMLDVLEAGGMPVLGSCRKGVCGTCEVRVLDGTPEHLDSVLSDQEKDQLGVMYPCVSRARSAELVLDL